MSITWEQSRIKLEDNIAATAMLCLPCRCIGDRSMTDSSLKLPEREEEEDSSRSEWAELDLSNFIVDGVTLILLDCENCDKFEFEFHQLFVVLLPHPTTHTWPHATCT
jgi:hypothetical protein